MLIPLIGVLFLLLILFYAFVWKQAALKPIPSFPVKYPHDKNKALEKDWYDVAVVGSGPSGATCGYFLGKLGWKCLILEKKKFPRDKYCGDAVCKTAIELLQEMGIYEKLLKENKAHVADSGGLCSPGGLSYVGRSKEEYGEIPAAIACKRIHLDEAIAMAAKRMGADLKEECAVSNAIFDKETGLWTIQLEESDRQFRARVLVCADGAPSRLAIQLGIVSRPPDSISSRAYVEANTHKFKADGLVFYPKDLLPGYAALFRHPGDELNYCVYIIPGNPKCTTETLPNWHDQLMKSDPNISRALGPDFKIERMKAASLRLGGEKRSFDNHVIVVGDAAGMIDPMTGEGIHHAMDGGKLAAIFLDEALNHGNYDKEVMAIYHQRWMDKFGSDFKWSMVFCQLLYRFPILLDAATMAIHRKGDKFLVRWADIMTGEIAHVSEPLPLDRFRFLVTDGRRLLEAIVSRIHGVLLCDIHETADGIIRVLQQDRVNVTFIGRDYVKDMFEKCMQSKVLEKSRRDDNVVPNDKFDGMPFKPDYKTGQPDGNGAHLAIFPGTKWCGYENNAKDMNDLGIHQATDACCRIHDHCPYYIDRFETKYNYRNMDPYTVSHCDCDQGLYDCLKKVHTTTSNEVGELFFGLLNVHCFRFEKGPYCEKYHWSGIWCEKQSVGMRAVMHTFSHKWNENTDNVITG